MKYFQLLFVSLFLSQAAQAQLPGWSHVQPILVQENSGSQVLGYQLPVIINTQALISNGEMLATGDDIRFTSACNGGEIFNYWIESGINTTTTKIWVKIDTLQASSYRTIYMNYGNASATTASALQNTFSGPHSSTDSLYNTNAGGVGNSQRGFRFSPTEDILVTAFGKFEPTGSNRYITLFNFATQAILRQGQVSGPAAQYTYSNLTDPVWLTQGTQYLLEMYQSTTDGYYFGAGPQMGQHLSYLDMRYCNGCDQNTFPTNVLGGMHYGYPDMWYFIKNNVTPEPTYTFDAYHLMPSSDSLYICMNDQAQLGVDAIGGTSPYMFSWTNTAIDDATLQSPTVSPTASMTYYVMVTDACGVVVSDSVYVEVKQLPEVEIQVSDALICNGETSELTVNGNDDYLWNTGSANDTVVVTPSVTTLYYVTATDAFGCSETDTAMVNVNVPLTATHNVEICANQSWQVGNHIYSMAGTYIDTLAGVTSCDSIVTTNLSVNPLPVATHEVEICFGDSLEVGTHYYTASGTYVDTLSGFTTCDSIITTVLTIKQAINAQIQQVGISLVANLGADGYQWVNCTNNQPIAGENGSTFEVTANGSYACIFTVDNCQKQSECIIIDDLAVEEFSDLTQILIYPNPANDAVTIFSGITQQISILDGNGRLLKVVQLNANESKVISVSELSSGIYLIRHGKFVSRLIVQ